MKILRIDSPPGSTDISVALMADSALRPDRRPLFLPPGRWESCVKMGVRIDRLGKAVRAKFAPRYYACWAPIHYLKPLDGQAWPDMYDDALVQGTWLPVGGSPIVLEGFGRKAEAVFPAAEFDALFERLSVATTFKTGDIIILPDVMLSQPAKPDTHIEITADGVSALSFNIK